MAAPTLSPSKNPVAQPLSAGIENPESWSSGDKDVP